MSDLQLEFSTRGGEFDPVLRVGCQRLQPVETRCDGHEYWAETDHEMSGEAFADLNRGEWPEWTVVFL